MVAPLGVWGDQSTPPELREYIQTQHKSNIDMIEAYHSWVTKRSDWNSKNESRMDAVGYSTWKKVWWEEYPTEEEEEEEEEDFTDEQKETVEKYFQTWLHGPSKFEAQVQN